VVESVASGPAERARALLLAQRALPGADTTLAEHDFQAALARRIVELVHEEPRATRSALLVSLAAEVDVPNTVGLCDALQVVAQRYGNAVTVPALRTLMGRATPPVAPARRFHTGVPLLAPLPVSLRDLQAEAEGRGLG
jgi:phosphohistidine swiveling domain-containing protein